MQGNGRTRVGARSVALATATLLALLVPAGAAVAAPSPASSTPTPDPTPGIGLQLGNISINVGLPLNLGGLVQVGDGTTTSAAPSTPPSGSSSPPTSAPPSSPATGSNEPTPTRTANHPRATSSPPSQGGFGQPAVPPGSHQHRTPAHRTTSTQPAKPRHRAGHGALELTKRLLPSSGTALLVSVLVVLALGVAIFVRLSGRRGGHQA